MGEITNHNCTGFCSELYCREIETHYQILEIRGFKFMVSFCEKHTEDFEKKLMGSRNIEKEVETCLQN